MFHWTIFVLIHLLVALKTVVSQEDYYGGDLSVIGLEKKPNSNTVKLSTTVLNFTEIANKYGYQSEVHTVITNDGYILTIFRLLKREHCKGANENIPPVLLQHPVLLSADSFIILGPEDGIGFNLADACHDVWFTNNRGTKYGLQHLNLNYKKDRTFWDFSFHEHGLYDTSAAIDYVLNATGFSKLNFIGFSHGATQLFVLLSENPEYNAKVNVGICLGPIAYISNVGLPLTKAIALILPKVQQANKIFGFTNFFAESSSLEKVFIKSACTQLGIGNCDLLFLDIIGYDVRSIFESQLRDILLTFPCGVSVKNLFHIGQLLNSDSFKQYDYFEETGKNMKVYGDSVPPSYILSNLNIPLVFITSKNDQIVDSIDLYNFTRRLESPPEVIQLEGESWTHLDLLFNVNIGEIVSPKIVDLLIKYNSKL